MTGDLEIPFDRVTYRDGQRLTALELRDEQQRDARLRRLHTRYLHDTWGIARGFEVRQVDDKGGIVEAEGTAVQVAPGYALDYGGRDIVLAERMHWAVPNLPGRETFVLTVGHHEDAQFRTRSDRAGPCPASGPDPRYQRPMFAWRRPTDVHFRREVPLVQVVVVNGIIREELNVRVRPHAEQLVRPHMASGITEAGRSGWRSWTEDTLPLGLEVDVNTSEAGFTEIPHYFAVLQGDFSNRDTEPPLLQTDVWPTETRPAFFLDTFGFISRATAGGFIYRIIGVGQSPFERPMYSAEVESREWTVSWLGVQHINACEPVVGGSRGVTSSGFPIRAGAREA